MQKQVVLVLSVIIGILFLAAGFSKAVDIEAFYHDLGSYGVGIGLAKILSIWIPGMEICLGFAMLNQMCLREAGLFTLGLLVVFSMALFDRWVTGETHIDCGCGGIFQDSKNSVVLLIGRNLLMIASAAFIIRHAD